MKKNKLLNILGWSLSFIPFFAVSCINFNQPKNVLNKNLDNWDNEITIVVPQINNGFLSTDLETNFLNKITDKFNYLKNQNSLVKDLPDVRFKIELNEEKEAIFQDLISNKNTVDLGFLSYTRFVDSLDTNSNINYDFQIVGQTLANKFIWSNLNELSSYKDGSMTDNLRILAEQQNIEQFKNYGEFPSWISKDKELNFNGSVYSIFYDYNQFTSVHRSSILIAGNLQQRNKIIEAWDNKDWDKFKSFGFVVRSFDSGTGFKYPIKLLSKHFNLSLEEIEKFFKSRNNNLVLVGSRPRDQLGKTDSNNFTYHIAFDNEGVFNWTRAREGRYQPTGYNKDLSNDYNSKNNVVVRNLIFSNPAPYDVLLGRKNLNTIQKELIIETLSNLSQEDNTFGIYTGYNKIDKIDFDLFKKYVEMQKEAQ
ncbi:hypothetical protein VBM87_01600 [Mycoplasma sp. 744]|uniref:ABC transporter thiamine pyrophosphate-binding lipoprotein p37/Cypl n=1 Tax=Mycoplasma sp. 744 TaxID=3108531 RepID=UPI002B1DACEE|nr:hypothetical protein [Mycoplasma sp. 744]MEA4115476.1 hypothetical protein [Mycoplasma sp. 744]